MLRKRNKVWESAGMLLVKSFSLFKINFSPEYDWIQVTISKGVVSNTPNNIDKSLENIQKIILQFIKL